MGIENKLIEAMVCDCPVITTRSGAAEINIANGTEGFVFENDDEIAEKGNETIAKIENWLMRLGKKRGDIF